MNHDLFPETLLVEQSAGQIFTTSLKVAEHFQKNHQHVLRDIKKLIAECPDSEFSLSNFGQSNYTNERGKAYPMYRLTHDGFAILAMGFTGPKALQWKIDFLNAFRQLEAELKARVEREASALYLLKPHYRTIGLGTEAGESRAAIAAKTGHKSLETITANRRRLRQLHLLH